MATVFLAQDLKHKRPVALKVLHPELAHALGPERFQREIELAARLQHPHILTVHDSGEAAGQLWFTMPFVEGESLRDRIRREKQLAVDEAIRIATKTARALDYAHRQGVVHRDIKPENILLTRDGDTLVADFGIARPMAGADERLTETGMAVGTPAYMSPEQATGDRVDARTDIYALGTVLYEMLVGGRRSPGPRRRRSSPTRYIARRWRASRSRRSGIRLATTSSRQDSTATPGSRSWGAATWIRPARYSRPRSGRGLRRRPSAHAWASSTPTWVGRVTRWVKAKRPWIDCPCRGKHTAGPTSPPC